MGFRQRAAEDGEILAEDIDHAAVDRAPAGDHAIARGRSASMPKSVQRWATNMSNSSNAPSSSSSSIRSRAVSLPLACCASMRRSPPPARAVSRRASSSARMSFMGALPRRFRRTIAITPQCGKRNRENLQTLARDIFANCDTAKFARRAGPGLVAGRPAPRETHAQPSRPRAVTIGLLLASNVFMTFAWYGHLKFKIRAAGHGDPGQLGHRLLRIRPAGAGEPDRPRPFLGGRAEDHPGGDHPVGLRRLFLVPT
jgi:hypothetical protein